MTNCTPSTLKFSPLNRKKIEANFSGGSITSDGGLLLLREIDKRIGLTKRLSKLMTDNRHASYVNHSVLHLLKQRVYALAAGYEDVNDHEFLRRDKGFQTVVGREVVLASAPTLSRFENSIDKTSLRLIASEMVEHFIDSFSVTPKELILDFDPTDNKIHGHQENRHYHGYYKEHCYLPLHVFCGDRLLVSYLRPSNIDGAKHAGAILRLLVKRLRQAWPEVNIIFRGDSAFARKRILHWCEQNNVSYIVGISGNATLKKLASSLEENAKNQFESSQEKQRLFETYTYQAKSWKAARKVIAKAEHHQHGTNLRFVVSNMKNLSAQELYDRLLKRKERLDKGLNPDFDITDYNTFIKAKQNEISQLETNNERLAQEKPGTGLISNSKKKQFNSSGKLKKDIAIKRLDEEINDYELIIEHLKKKEGMTKLKKQRSRVPKSKVDNSCVKDRKQFNQKEKLKDEINCLFINIDKLYKDNNIQIQLLEFNNDKNELIIKPLSFYTDSEDEWVKTLKSNSKINIRKTVEINVAITKIEETIENINNITNIINNLGKFNKSELIKKLEEIINKLQELIKKLEKIKNINLELSEIPFLETGIGILFSPKTYAQPIKSLKQAQKQTQIQTEQKQAQQIQRLEREQRLVPQAQQKQAREQLKTQRLNIRNLKQNQKQINTERRNLARNPQKQTQKELKRLNTNLERRENKLIKTLLKEENILRELQNQLKSLKQSQKNVRNNQREMTDDRKNPVLTPTSQLPSQLPSVPPTAMVSTQMVQSSNQSLQPQKLPQQVKLNQTPVNPNQTPVNPNQTPVKPNQTPVNPNQTPVKPNQTPVNPNQTPVKPNQTPKQQVKQQTPKQQQVKPNQTSKQQVKPNQTPKQQVKQQTPKQQQIGRAHV